MKLVETLRNKFVRDAATLQFAGFLNRFSQAASAIALAFLLGADGQGLFISAVALQALFYFLVNLGVAQATASQVAAAAARGNAALSVGHVERFQPGLRKVKEMGIAPRFIECHRLAPFSFRSMDVGVVHDLMIHDLDLILHLVDSEVETLDAAGGAICTGAVS